METNKRAVVWIGIIAVLFVLLLGLLSRIDLTSDLDQLLDGGSAACIEGKAVCS